MKIKNTIGRNYRFYLEKKNLSNLKKIPCNTDRLSKWYKFDLKYTFNDHTIQRNWEAIKIDGHTDNTIEQSEGKALFFLINEYKPLSVLEIGAHNKLTQYIAAALTDVHSGSGIDAVLATVNPKIAQTSGNEPAAPYLNINKDGIIYMQQNSNPISFMKNCGMHFDLIVLNNDNDAATAYQEIVAALNLINNNGIIILRNYFPNRQNLSSYTEIKLGPWLAVKRLIGEGMKARVLPFGKLPWETVPASGVSGMAILARI